MLTETEQRERRKKTYEIIPGKHHFSLWVRHDARRWREFVPGYHFDLRQLPAREKESNNDGK